MNKNWSIKRYIILLVLTGITSCTTNNCPVNTDPTSVTSDGSTEIILYCSNIDDGQEIYVIGVDGSNPIEISNAPPDSNNCYGLTWLPNGKQISFLSDFDNEGDQLYQVNLDGSGLLNLTTKYNVGDDFSWSPDGEYILFTTSDGIYTMRANGSERRKIHDKSSTIPVWSPNGQLIAFNTEENGKDAIYVINADGSGLRQVTKSRDTTMYSTFYLDWSPDSERIAFRAMLDDNNYEIAIANQDGSGELILTNNPAKDDWPSWSPDGRQIAFYSDRDGNFEIYKINADGSNLTRLTHNKKADVTPKWSSDGTKIVFISGDSGERQVFIMNSDGSCLTQLTHDEGSKCCISLQP